jgi:hypothetical protein
LVPIHERSKSIVLALVAAHRVRIVRDEPTGVDAFQQYGCDRTL